MRRMLCDAIIVIVPYSEQMWSLNDYYPMSTSGGAPTT